MSDFIAEAGAHCPAGHADILLDHLGRFDEAALDALWDLFEPLEDGAPPAPLCRRAIVGELARGVRRDAPPDYVHFLLAQAWAVHELLDADPDGARHLDPGFTGAVRGAFAILPYTPPAGPGDYAQVYFGCARAYGADVRDAVRPFIEWDWDFGDDYLSSETWQHARYLAGFGDAAALAALEARLASVEAPNLLVWMLRDLAGIRTDRVRALIAGFGDDPRLTDLGIANAPRRSVGQEVEAILARW